MLIGRYGSCPCSLVRLALVTILVRLVFFCYLRNLLLLLILLRYLPQQKERQEQVARENNILIRKILELDCQPRMERYRTFHRLPTEFAGVPRTLNGLARRRALEAITRENKDVLARIIQAPPTFDRYRWGDDERERRVLSSRIAARPRCVMLTFHHVIAPRNYHEERERRAMMLPISEVHPSCQGTPISPGYTSDACCN